MSNEITFTKRPGLPAQSSPVGQRMTGHCQLTNNTKNKQGIALCVQSGVMCLVAHCQRREVGAGWPGRGRAAADATLASQQTLTSLQQSIPDRPHRTLSRRPGLTYKRGSRSQ